MAEESKLPEQWQELPQVKSLVEEAAREARAPLAALTRERDQLQSEMQKLKAELKRLREEAAAPPENKPDTASTNSKDGAAAELKRLQALGKQQKERIQTLENELQTKNRRLAEEILERGIRDAVAKVGQVHKDAWADVVSRGKATFSLDEQGNPVARDAAGNVLYGKDNIAPMTFEEWARKLLAEAPHLFKASGGTGSGAAGGGGKEGSGSAVVISREEARNPLAYRRAKEKAAQKGVELTIQ